MAPLGFLVVLVGLDGLAEVVVPDSVVVILVVLLVETLLVGVELLIVGMLFVVEEILVVLPLGELPLSGEVFGLVEELLLGVGLLLL